MAGVLDSARFRHFLAEEFEVSVEDVTAFVLGGHGDTMVPLTRYSTVAGIPLPDLVKMGWTSKKKIGRDRPAHPRRRRPEIVGLLKTGSAFLLRRHRRRSRWPRVISRTKSGCWPCAVNLTGQYGVRGMYVGVPAVIGAKGVERVVEIALNRSGKETVRQIGRCVRGLIAIVRKMMRKAAAKPTPKRVAARRKAGGSCRRRSAQGEKRGAARPLTGQARGKWFGAGHLATGDNVIHHSNRVFGGATVPRAWELHEYS